jgi:hypothetical protein
MTSGKPFHFLYAEGEFSRQAHVNLPRGTCERAIGSERFFWTAGPSQTSGAPPAQRVGI